MIINLSIIWYILSLKRISRSCIININTDRQIHMDAPTTRYQFDAASFGASERELRTHRLTSFNENI